MNTSWNDLELIEDYLLQRSSPEQRNLVQLRLQTDSAFYEAVRWQQTTYAYVRSYGRAQLKKELQQVENKIFEHPSYEIFQQTINQIFS